MHHFQLWIGRIVSFLAVIVLFAWLIGRIVSDRYAWSQWLLWIPTPVAILAVIIGFLVSFRPGARQHSMRNRVIRWAAYAIVVIGYFMFVEHRFFRSSEFSVDESNSIRLIHWNITRTYHGTQEQLIQSLIDLDGDVTVITDPGFILRDKLVRAQLSDGRRELRMGTLALLTRLPFKSIPPVISTEGINIFPVEIDTTEIVGRPMVFYLVDLPSDPTIPRMELARKARELLERLRSPRPDVVVGDLNLTRGSTSLNEVFPEMRHAFCDAGSGYGATFPRWFPVYHIDHILLGQNAIARVYEVVDTGTGRHRAQAAQITVKSHPSARPIDRAASTPIDASGHP